MSLYRTYRPKTFTEVTGQPHVVNALSAAITSGSINHAYLFQGPRGTGKTTVARLLAKRLNCQKAKATDPEPCNNCEACTAAKNGALDVIEIDAASNRGIDDIRALRENILTAPAIGKYKVYIIDEVHMLTGEAFAALLKTLEEPVTHAVFVLATTELHKVPETIKSRCQVFRFRRASAEEMNARLTHILKQEKRKLGEDVINFIINRSDGCYRDAESLLGQILSLDTKDTSLENMMELLGMPSVHVITDFVAALHQRDTHKALEAVQAAYERGYDPELFIEESIRYARDTSVATVREGGTAGNYPVVIRNLVQAKQDLAYVPQPLIALQLAILSTAPATTERPSPTPAPTTATVPTKSATPPQPAPTPVAPAPAIAYSEPTPTPDKPLKSSSANSHSADNLRSAWPNIISTIKPQSPAASTFLRAMEPQEVDGETLTLKAQYALHRNFFEKPDNKKILVDAIEKETGTTYSIKIALADTPNTPTRTNRSQSETELLQNVQEIFGAK